MKIGILKTGHVPDALAGQFPDYDRMFMRLLDGPEISFRTFDVEAGEMPAAPEDCGGWLITGSRCGVYEDHAWIAPLEDFIRASRDADVPMVGVCFGHQIIAQAMGARVEKFEGGWSLGAVEYAFEAPDETLTVMAFHQDQVLTEPEGATLIASSAVCRYAGFTYGTWALTVQPHPEFDAAYVQALLDTYATSLPEDRALSARDSLGNPLSTARLVERMNAVLRRQA